jgi:hypothetical protein
MFWNKKKWALEISYPGLDPQLDGFLKLIAAQHGGRLSDSGIDHAHRDLEFDFHDRLEADVARSEMLSFRPGVIAAAALEPRP